MANAYVVTGTLTDARTVQLDEPLPIAGGKVRVVVEAAAPAAKPALMTVMERVWAEQAARGQAAPSPQEVEERIREVRAGWDE